MVEIFGKNDISCQYFDERYPYMCDFYVKSKDLFIEIQGNWTHGGRPFDPNDESCQRQLKEWEEKAKTSKYYANAIYTWTELDVRKKHVLESKGLNHLIVYVTPKNLRKSLDMLETL